MVVAKLLAQPPPHQSPLFFLAVLPHPGSGALSAIWTHQSFPSGRFLSDFSMVISELMLSEASSSSYLPSWK